MWGDAQVPGPDEYIDRTFGWGGYLAQHGGPSYQPRQGQIELAQAVDRALSQRTHLLSEAPTGTGKAFSYSVPATYHAAMGHKVVVIVTANIALQEQLIRKDLPFLSEALPWAFSFALLKGRNNYLCRAQYEDELIRVNASRRQQTMFGAEHRGGESATEREKLQLLEWAEGQIERGEFGDISALSWRPTDKLWRELSVGADECRGSDCEWATRCGATAAQQRARESQVVVTNYHIFFANLLIYMERAVDVVLPPFDAAIFDECHAAADVARDFFGWEVSEVSVRRAIKYFRNTDQAAVESAQRAGAWFFTQMLALRHDRDRYKAHLRTDQLRPGDREAGRLLLEELWPFRDTLARALEGADPRARAPEIGEARVAHKKLERVIGAIGTILEGPGDNEVLYIEEDEFHKVHVKCRLVRPGLLLRGELFGKTVKRGEDALPVAVVGTSATLATGSSFSFAESELGADRYDSLIVESPFDYESQALFIIPEICDPNDPEFSSEVAAVFLRTIELARGRTLGLFTSRKRMNEVRDAVGNRTPFRILCQDDGQRTQLVEQFRADTHSCLLGVASFWTGVDVPGESLSVVFIDKLPFPPPDDPVLERLTETDKRAWAAYAVPRAIIDFKQGVGRLIRSCSDRGVIVCCDTRLVTKGYGKLFLKALPRGMQKIRNLGAIRDWLDGPTVPPAAGEEVVDPLS